MTTNSFKSLHTLLIFAMITALFTSCLKDDCKQDYTYKLYKPVYMSYADLRKAVITTPATPLHAVGKIYYTGEYIFVNELNKGIHVIDNSNPSSPQNIAFINIPGNLDIAVKDHILYADSYVDFVAIDISDPAHAKEIWREEQVFPQRTYAYGWEPSNNNAVVTDWILSDTTITGQCNTQMPGWYDYPGGIAFNEPDGNSSSAGGQNPGIGVAGSMARFGITQDHLYCLNSLQLDVFDISNAATPVYNGVVSMNWNVETLFPYNNNLYIGTSSGMSIYDASNPLSPILLSGIPHVTGCDPVVANGKFAYFTIHSGDGCGSNFNELNVVDLNNIMAPAIVRTLNLSRPLGLGVDGNTLFVCDDSAGLKMYDVSNPIEPRLTQTIDAGSARDVIPWGGLLILASANGIYEFDYSTGQLNQLSFIPVIEN